MGSNVPLGNIGGITSEEKEALAARDKVVRGLIGRAVKREEEIRDGTAFLPKNKYKMSLCAFPNPPDASTEECLKDTGQLKGWKSEASEGCNNAVHARTQVPKYDIQRSLRGATKLKLEGCAAETRSFKRQNFAGAGGQLLTQSAPTLSRST